MKEYMVRIEGMYPIAKVTIAKGVVERSYIVGKEIRIRKRALCIYDGLGRRF